MNNRWYITVARAFLGALLLCMLATASFVSSHYATRAGIMTPHVEVHLLEGVSRGAKLKREQLSSTIAWAAGPRLSRPVMNVIDERLSRSVKVDQTLTDADLDETSELPSKADGTDAACKVATSDGDGGVLCLQPDADGRLPQLAQLLSHLDQLQREDRDDVPSAKFLRRSLERIADWYGIRLGDNLVPLAEAPHPPTSAAPRAITVKFGPDGITPLTGGLAGAAAQVSAHNDCVALVIVARQLS
jgi:hypothetical protein